ncbi:hypothetical protein [Cohnella soli]|uniref:Uncharacterized protein n=1 Tax=Cohnella soli TaxID=425005 RepID=A0ABW0HR74_9BACL
MLTAVATQFAPTPWQVQFRRNPEVKLHRELLKYIYENHLSERTMPNINREFVPQNDYGWTALAFDAGAMQLIPAHARSMPSLLKKIEKYNYQYYRPNLSYTSKSHKKRQLRWLVALIFDFDAENLRQLRIHSSEQLVEYVESFGYIVCGVVRTSSGFHVYLPMQPLRGEWNGQRTIQRYDLVLKRMAKQLGSDPRAATAEHYFRTPQAENVVYFRHAEKPHFDFYEEQMGGATEKAAAEGSISFGRLMSQAAMLKMLSGEFDPNAVVVNPVTNESRSIGRNNAAFTLALGMKADGWTEQQATDELKAWYCHRISRYGFNWSEVVNAIKHAFSNDYKGPSPLYVYAFTGLKLRPLSKKKTKEERVRQPFKETEDLLISYLQRYYQEMEKDLVMSQTKLASALGVKIRSLQHVLKDLKERGMLDVHTKREGRSNVSIYFLDQTLLPEMHGVAETVLESANLDGTATSTHQPEANQEPQREPSEELSAKPQIHPAISVTYFLAIGHLRIGSRRSFSAAPGYYSCFEERMNPDHGYGGGGNGPPGGAYPQVSRIEL